MIRALQFLALVLTALALVPGGAHLFALPNKIDLAATDYVITQTVYRGWALFGVPMIGALVVDLLLVLLLRRQRPAFWLALLGFAGMAAALTVFFIWTFPANQATANWTTIPADWRLLRHHWEYGHAAGAVLTFVSFCALTLSVLVTRR